MKEHEELIWKYLDGHCDHTEQKEFQHRLEKDAAFKQSFEALEKINRGIKFMELEKPSLDFTSKVMGAISAMKPYEMFSSKRFFLILMSSLAVIFASSFFIPGVSGGNILPQLNVMDKVSIDTSFISSLAQYNQLFFAVLVFTCLIWMDYFLGKKINRRSKL